MIDQPTTDYPKNKTMKPHLPPTILAVLGAVAVSFSPVRAEDEEAGKPIAQDQVPAAALAAIKKYAGEGKVEKILVEKHGGATVYEALIKGPGKLTREVAVTKDGQINSEEKVIPLADVPEKVRAAMEARASGGKITEVIRIQEAGTTIYEAEIEKDGKKTEVKFTADGKVKTEQKEEEGRK